MISFSEYSKYNDPFFQDVVYNIFEMMELLECDNILNESQISEQDIKDIKSKVDSALSASGIKVERTKGLIDYLKLWGVVMTKFVVAAIRGDTETVKKIANTEITKQDFLDFILKLDMAALHTLSVPLHFIHGVTGWDVLTGVKNIVKKPPTTTVDTFKDALAFIKRKASLNFEGKLAKKIINRADALENLLGKTLINI
jgi:hypothetical protein